MAFFVFLAPAAEDEENIAETDLLVEETEIPAEKSDASASESDFPELNEKGFLDSGEFVYENDEEGLWRYASDTLRVEVRRLIQEKPARTWYEAEIFCAEGADVPHMIPLDPDHWMTKRDYPYKVARETRTVIAISADYAWHRYLNKARVGILLRNGKVWSTKTRKKGANQFPNLDTLALFPDGDMKVFDSDELTAEEYVEMGARDVLAFGPWLIRDGERNEYALAKYGASSAERVAVGMVEKGHYWFMMLEGRIRRSKGDGIDFLTDRLEEKGCQLAFNLDGGQTACIVFMGHQLCKMDNKPRNLSSRRTAEILGVGTSDLVPAVGDPW
ncbi:MAG: phosphodiester glycosidase family protein [Clostridia bacterium]|nr:phosphodiester glycosidase family protein [Clostridia bacterium]